MLVLASYYLPGSRAGGPVRSLSNLVEALGDEFEFQVLTRDRDWNEHEPYEGAKDGKARRVGKATVRYLRPSISASWAVKQETERLAPDLLYFNSFFDPFFSILPLVFRRLGLIPRMPVLIAPRGQFAPGALGLKAFKKRSYLTAAKWMRLLDGLQWHATAESEAADIIRIVGREATKVTVAPNLGRPIHDREQVPNSRVRENFAVAAIGRVSPEKNLLQALRIVCASKHPLQFDIYGPIGDRNYWNMCQKAIADRPSHVSINYRGAIESDRVPEVLAGYDTFLSTTLGENFGHSIVEALTAGIPVLISDRTPWRGLREANAGYDLPLHDDRGFIDALETLSLRTADQVAKMRAGTLAYAQKIHTAADALRRTRLMLGSALSGEESGGGY